MPPPSKKAKMVRSNNAPAVQSDILSYPDEGEYNEPPSHFSNYLRCIFGSTGSGKTTLVSQFPKHLTLMFEPRRRNLRIRQVNLQKHTAKEIMDGATDTWNLIKNTTQLWIDDKSIDGLNFDSVDLAYECCYHSICASHEVQSPAGAGKGGSDIWIEIRDEWASYFDALAATEMGINFVSHMKLRESEELDGSKYAKRSPSCAPACLQYIKQAVDFVFFYGKLNGKRVIQVRDDTGDAEVASGVEGTFLDPNGKPITYLEMPPLGSDISGYQRLCDAFDNKCWDAFAEPEEEAPKKKAGPPRKGPPKK